MKSLFFVVNSVVSYASLFLPLQRPFQIFVDLCRSPLHGKNGRGKKTHISEGIRISTGDVKRVKAPHGEARYGPGGLFPDDPVRSEERRVGNEGRVHMGQE